MRKIAVLCVLAALSACHPRGAPETGGGAHAGRRTSPIPAAIIARNQSAISMTSRLRRRLGGTALLLGYAGRTPSLGRSAVREGPRVDHVGPTRRGRLAEIARLRAERLRSFRTGSPAVPAGR